MNQHARSEPTDLAPLWETWQAKVEAEIMGDAQQLRPAERNRRISALYAKWGRGERAWERHGMRRPEYFQWALLAAFASNQVGQALSLKGILLNALGFVGFLLCLLKNILLSALRLRPLTPDETRRIEELAHLWRRLLDLLVHQKAIPSWRFVPDLIAYLRETNDAVVRDIGWTILYYREEVLPRIERYPQVSATMMSSQPPENLRMPSLTERYEPEDYRNGGVFREAIAAYKALVAAISDYGQRVLGIAPSENQLLQAWQMIFDGHMMFWLLERGGPNDWQQRFVGGNLKLLLHEQSVTVQRHLFARLDPYQALLLSFVTFLDFDGDAKKVDNDAITFVDVGGNVSLLADRLAWISKAMLPRWGKLRDTLSVQGTLRAMMMGKSGSQPAAPPVRMVTTNVGSFEEAAAEYRALQAQLVPDAPPAEHGFPTTADSGAAAPPQSDQGAIQPSNNAIPSEVIAEVQVFQQQQARLLRASLSTFRG